MLTGIRRGLRRGVTLFEVVVAVGIIAIVSAVMTINIGASSREGGEARRLDDVAFILAKLADAIGRFNGVGGSTSFAQVIGVSLTGGVNPGRLSHLTTKIVGSSGGDPLLNKNSCGNVYSSTEAARWTGTFYPIHLPNIGYKIADGFFAEDTLSRYNSVTRVPEKLVPNSLSAVGTLAIVMKNVSASDARALAIRVEGDQGGIIGAVRFDPNAGNAPVTVYYHINIHGC